MPKFLLHSLFLLTAVVLAFFWTSSPTLSLYTLQLVAFFVLVFFANQLASRHAGSGRANLTIDAVIFTLVTLLLVISTGGLTSPLFFLLYFLMFGLALLFEPLISLSLTGAMILFFAISLASPAGGPTDKSGLEEVLQLFSLIMVTPLALFFGREYLQVLRDEEKIRILEEEGEVLEKEIQKEETDVLLWASLELKQGLAVILDELSQLLADLSHLTITQKERLLKIRQTALKLLKSGEKLKEEVDKTTDE